MYWVKKFRYSGLTNCVHVINKSRGSGMHWVGGGGLKSTKIVDNTPHVMGELNLTV